MPVRYLAAALLGLAFGVAGACRSDFECDRGTVDCECLAAGGCDSDLECVDGRCVTADTETDGGSSTDGGDGDSGDGDGDSGDGDSGDGDSGDGDSGDGDGDGDSTAGDDCGDGVLDPGEECDGTPECTDCTLNHFDCNPLNGAGCPAGFTCSYTAMDPGLFRCEATAGEGTNGAPCTSLTDDTPCATGYKCQDSFFTEACASGFCCTLWCDTRDMSFVCPDPGDICYPFWVSNPMSAGLDHIGSCSVP